MIVIYRFIYFILMATAWILKPVFSKNLQRWLELRSRPLPKGIKPNAVWFHASSGEIEYSKAVIREIKNLHPELSIVVTYSSPSAQKLFWNIQELVDHFIPLPWDTPWHISNLIKTLHPSILVFSRTDFWFELITQAKKMHIPMVAISTFPRFSSLSNFWLKKTLGNMKLVTTVRADLSENLKSLLSTVPVKTLNDTRFDQVFYRLSQQSKIEIHTTQKLVVFASTWPEDDKHLFSTAKYLLQNNYSLIWCPHDVGPENVTRIKSEIHEFSPLLFSEQNPLALHLQDQILILDKVGYLADVYRFTEWAFVGGSFKAKVHSVMEPLCAGNPVAVGPHYKNNPEAILFAEKNFVFPVQDAQDLLALASSGKLSELKNPLHAELKKYHGSSAVVAKEILDLVSKNVNSGFQTN